MNKNKNHIHKNKTIWKKPEPHTKIQKHFFLKKTNKKWQKQYKTLQNLNKKWQKQYEKIQKPYWKMSKPYKTNSKSYKNYKTKI